MTMLLTPPVGPIDRDVPDVAIFRLTVDQYHDMLRNGTLTDGDPVELLEGWLVQKMSEDLSHAVTVELTSDVLRAVTPHGWHVRGPHPVTTTDSEPEPDVAIIRGKPRDYGDRHPGPTDSALVVEVANSSVGRDRGIKRRLYARAGMPAYWIVLVRDRGVEVYTDPTGPAGEPAYATVRRFADGELVPVVIDGREVGTVAVADLLP